MTTTNANKGVKIPDTWSVRHMSSKEGKEFIKTHHYTHGCHNGPMCWGLYDGDDLIGVIAFATPSSENVRSSLFGPEFKHTVTELHRLVVLDGTPSNTESWFIARGLKELKKYKPYLKAVISFADSTEGHVGTIYQATNALYCGTTSPATFYLDETGRLRHPRQNGVNITKKMAAERGWIPTKRGGKNRYVFLLGSPKQKRLSRKTLLLNPEPYPNPVIPEAAT